MYMCVGLRSFTEMIGGKVVGRASATHERSHAAVTMANSGEVQRMCEKGAKRWAGPGFGPLFGPADWAESWAGPLFGGTL